MTWAYALAGMSTMLGKPHHLPLNHVSLDVSAAAHLRERLRHRAAAFRSRSTSLPKPPRYCLRPQPPHRFTRKALVDGGIQLTGSWRSSANSPRSRSSRRPAATTLPPSSDTLSTHPRPMPSTSPRSARLQIADAAKPTTHRGASFEPPRAVRQFVLGRLV
jgi:hypothetical protein